MSRRQRPRGEGTLTYDEKRKRWIYKLPPDEAGRRPQVSGKTQAEALEKAKALKARRDQGISTDGKQPTVAAWAALYLDQIASKKRPSTAQGYRQMVDYHIVPGLGAIRLDRLTPDHVQAWVDALARRYAVATVRNAYKTLRAMMRLAVNRRRIAYAPTTGIELPVDDEVHARALTLDECRALLLAADGLRDQRKRGRPRVDRNATLYHVCLVLGLRRGEALGLAWRAINWTDATVTIDQQVQSIGGKTVIQRGAKMGKRRVLPIPAPLLARLAEHRAAQAEERRFLGPEWKEHGMVFASERGTPVSPSNLWRTFRATCARAGVEPPRLHDLRHTCATMLGRLKVSRDVIAAVLGHAPDNVTAQYVHVDIEQMRDALSALCAVLYAPGGASDAPAAPEAVG